MRDVRTALTAGTICHSDTKVTRLSAWELVCHALPTTVFAAQRLLALSVSTRYRPSQTVLSGTQRARPVWGDPSLVSYRHPVGYCRSPGNTAFRRPTPSTGVVCRCGQRWWSTARLTAPEAVGRQCAYLRRLRVDPMPSPRLVRVGEGLFIPKPTSNALSLVLTKPGLSSLVSQCPLASGAGVVGASVVVRAGPDGCRHHPSGAEIASLR